MGSNVSHSLTYPLKSPELTSLSRPRGLRIIIRPTRPSKHQQQKEHDAKKTQATVKKPHPHLPTALQKLVDAEEKEVGLYEDSWARIPRVIGIKSKKAEGA
jgi:hypothetical protein